MNLIHCKVYSERSSLEILQYKFFSEDLSLKAIVARRMIKKRLTSKLFKANQVELFRPLYQPCTFPMIAGDSGILQIHDSELMQNCSGLKLAIEHLKFKF